MFFYLDLFIYSVTSCDTSCKTSSCSSDTPFISLNSFLAFEFNSFTFNEMSELTSCAFVFKSSINDSTFSFISPYAFFV